MNMNAPCVSTTAPCGKLLSSSSSSSQTNSNKETIIENPTAFVRQMLSGGGKKRLRSAASSTSSHTSSSDHDDDDDENHDGNNDKRKCKQRRMDNYDFARVNAVRANDIETLRSLLSQGKSLDACNRTGETLLHLACRRGNREMIEFLVQEADLDVHVQDDLGRTVLHDVCWRPLPATEIMDTLIRVMPPDILLLEDGRGHSCFDYCRREHWEEWIAFLKQHQALLQRRFDLIQGAL